LFERISRIAFARKPVLAAAFATLTLPLLIGATSPSAGATSLQSAGTSAFCTTIKVFAVAEPPKYVTISTYRVWAKLYLPSYEKLASEAPTKSVKTLLNDAVTAMKYEESATSLSKLEKFIVAHRAVWNRGVTAISKSVIACYTSS
jgi:hypothetical protein